MTLPDPPQASPTPGRHRLDRHHFDALAAGGGDVGTVSQLVAAERSWRLVQLRAVLDAVRDHPDPTGPLPPLEQAWQVLVAAQQRAPSEVDGLLLHPLAGTWAGYVLRRLRGSGGHPTDAPLWADVGYLHALAAAAGVRAGLELSLEVPVRDGFVVLPTLGGAHLPVAGRWEQAQVRAAAGEPATVAAAGTTVRVVDAGDAGVGETGGPDGTGEPDQRGGADGTGGWVALPTVRAQAGGHTLSVTLDHLDPYRTLRGPCGPDRLPAERVRRWRTLTAEAWQLLVDACPHLAAPIGRGLFSVAPQPPAERFRTRSASAGDAFGGMIASEPEDAAELAVTLVHEFQHIKLGGLLHLATLHHGEPAQRLYAPWRDDPRPLGGLLQGVYAFVGIVEFWRSVRQVAAGRTAPLAQFEFARWRAQVQATLHLLASLPELTALGRELVAGLAATAAQWHDEPVPAPLQAAADAAVTDHRARWRMHHLRPDPQVVTALAHAWRTGATPPDLPYPAPEVSTDASAGGLDSRAVLRLWHLTDAAGFALLQRDPAAVGQRVSGATEADLAYVAGDLDRARALYLDALSGPTEGTPAAWAGLGLVDGEPALRSRPELVREVHRETLATGGRADPGELARWLAHKWPGA